MNNNMPTDGQQVAMAYKRIMGAVVLQAFQDIRLGKVPDSTDARLFLTSENGRAILHGQGLFGDVHQAMEKVAGMSKPISFKTLGLPCHSSTQPRPSRPSRRKVAQDVT